MIAKINKIRKQKDGICVEVLVGASKESRLFSPTEATTENINQFVADVERMEEQRDTINMDTAFNLIKQHEGTELDLSKSEKL